MFISKIILKIKQLIIIIVVITNFHIINSFSSYTAITESGKNVIKFYEAMEDILSDYKKNNTDVNTITNNNISANIKNLTKKKLDKLIGNFLNIERYSKEIIKVYNLQNTENLEMEYKIETFFSILESFIMPVPNEEIIILNIINNIKTIIVDYDKALDNTRIYTDKLNDKQLTYLADLNLLIDIIHMFDMIFESNKSNKKRFFDYVAAYVDMDTIIKLDYSKPCFDFDDNLYQILALNINGIKHYYIDIKETIKPISSDLIFQQTYSSKTKKIIDDLDKYHHKLIKRSKYL